MQKGVQEFAEEFAEAEFDLKDVLRLVEAVNVQWQPVCPPTFTFVCHSFICISPVPFTLSPLLCLQFVGNYLFSAFAAAAVA